MKNDLKKLALLLLFGALALGGCAIENRGHHRGNNRNDHGRNDRNHHYDNRDHHYNNY